MPILENLENSKRVLKIDHHSLTHQAEETAVNTSAQLLSVFFLSGALFFSFFMNDIRPIRTLQLPM